MDQVSGNPITTAGDWSYNPDDPWTIFTDASDIAWGAVLFIGETKVEDVTKLRKKDDRRHINVSELQAVRDGILLATDYIKALQLKEEKIITIKCDNQSAIAWLKQFTDKKWRAIKGLSAKMVERLLHQIADLCKIYSIKLIRNNTR